MINNLFLNADNNDNKYQDHDLDNTDFGYKLYPEQKKILYVMRKLEMNESIISKGAIDQTGNIIYYNTLRLGAPFSFGKSIVSLALIKTKNDPLDRNWYSFFNNEDIIELKIKRPIYINTTLIIVSPSTFYQWVGHIEKANLKALFINTLEDLDNLYVNLINNTFDKFDVVILVYRKLKHSYEIPFNRSYLHGSYTNVTLLSILSIDKLWRRVMIDDFDTINLYNDLSIPAKIIWLISATENYTSSRSIGNNSSIDICSVNHRILDALKDPYLETLTVEASLKVKIPIIEVYCYIFEYGRMVNQVLNNLDYPIEVCEKINSGDISGAASVLGMSRECSSMGEFFYLLIHKNKQSYTQCIKLCSHLETLIKLIEDTEYPLLRDNIRDDNSEHPVIIISTLPIGDDNKWNNYFRKLLDQELYITREEYINIQSCYKDYKENAGNFKIMLERIKRNIEDGLCGKCYCEPEEDRFILQCCNIMLCKYCMIRNNTNIFIDKCPNCCKLLDKHSFINMPKSISLDDFISIDYEDAFTRLRDFNQSSIDIEDYNENMELLPKDRALISILNNIDPKDCIIHNRIGLHINNITESDIRIEQKEGNLYNKYLIFTKWSYCTYKISALLTKRGIKHIILKGTNTRAIKRSIEKFKNSSDINVMLVASQDVCAGLNLEFVTHLIFYHSIRRRSVTSQIIGRVQRIGRTCSLKLISLENQFEVGMFLG